MEITWTFGSWGQHLLHGREQHAQPGLVQAKHAVHGKKRSKPHLQALILSEAQKQLGKFGAVANA